ncbi:hypothetical protein FQR65_LT09162 [Abscondita terminalis]|nr:hypothetical protein FQR65_LT09162 [Abscondita terminalis]
MNFNANTGARQSTGRKVKRVSDVNAMGYNPYNQQQPQQQPPFQQNANMNSSNIGYNATTIGNTFNHFRNKVCTTNIASVDKTS